MLGTVATVPGNSVVDGIMFVSQMKKYLSYYILFFIISIISCRSSVTDTKLETTVRNMSVVSYYVDENLGNDNNPGTRDNPIKTVAELNSRLNLKAGSSFFASGQIFEGTLNLRNISGSSGSKIIISSYGEGRACISGGNNEAIIVEDCNRLIISNMNVKGSGRKEGNSTNGIALIRTTNSTVENINTEGFQKSGLDLHDCSGIEVKKVSAFNNGFCGINIMGSEQKLSHNILISYCRAENNPGDPAMLDNHSGNGILVGVSDNVIVDHCTATNNGWDMPREGNGPVGIWTWQSNNVIIQHCVSYRNKTSMHGKDGGGFDLDGGVTNSIIQYCLSYENEGAGYGLFQYWGASDWSDNIVRNNVSINDGLKTAGSGSFFLWNGSGEAKQLSDCEIYNNIVYSDSVPVISFENASAHKNFNFHNNIFIGSGQLISGKNSGSAFYRNIWWGLRKADKYQHLEIMKLNRFFQTLTEI